MWLLMLAPVMGSLLKDGGGAARVVITAPRNRFVALAKEMRGRDREGEVLMANVKGWFKKEKRGVGRERDFIG